MNNCLLRCSYVAWFSEISLTFFVEYIYMRINSAMAAILMTSLFTPQTDLRCVNWIQFLLMPQILN